MERGRRAACPSQASEFSKLSASALALALAMAGVGASVATLMTAADGLLRAYFRQMGSMEHSRWRCLLNEADESPEPRDQGHMQLDIHEVLRQRTQLARAALPLLHGRRH